MITKDDLFHFEVAYHHLKQVSPDGLPSEAVSAYQALMRQAAVFESIIWSSNAPVAKGSKTTDEEE